jgi:5-(carboxyamino)imidazole ribonucleotide synthase
MTTSPPSDTPSRSKGTEDRPVLGIVGGGQLARMMLEAASRLDIDARLLATRADESAPSVWPRTTVVEALDERALMDFAAACDVITFDHELVEPQVLDALESRGHTLRPSAAALGFSDKAAQRASLQAAGLPLPRFAVVTDLDGVVDFANSVGGWPVVLKPARGGYDGRGVHVVGGPDDARPVVEGADGPVVAEELLDIEAELAVVVVRRPRGDQPGRSVSYPVLRTVQVDGICVEVSLADQLEGVDGALVSDARRIAEAVAAQVGAVGVLAVELFVTGGRVLVNEVAPRPHNSGHLTIDASDTSQFENHLRAVLDWPLGSTASRTPAAVMLNVIGREGGADPSARQASALAVPDVHVHLYGKGFRPGRKLGHVTATAADLDAARAAASEALERLHGTA